jgi:hypothetical protein
VFRLQFSFCIDVTDNELAYLESIHLFVEMLDRYFGNVCELDLVFNFHKVRGALGLCYSVLMLVTSRFTPSWMSTLLRVKYRRRHSSSCWIG